MKKLIVLTLALVALIGKDAIAMQGLKLIRLREIEKQLEEVKPDLRKTLRLTQAVYDADVDEVQSLLRLGANPNLEYKYWAGHSAPLMVAAHQIGYYQPYLAKEDYIELQKSYIAIMNLLINAGADVNKQDICGFTPLMLALVYKGENEYTLIAGKILLDAGAKVSLRTNYQDHLTNLQKTALEMTCSGNTKTRALLEAALIRETESASEKEFLFEGEKEALPEERVEIEEAASELEIEKEAIEEEKAALIEKETEIKLREKLKAIHKEFEIKKEKEAKKTVLKQNKNENTGQLQRVSSFISNLWWNPQN